TFDLTGARLSRRRASVRVAVTVACRDQVRLYRVPRATPFLLVVRLCRKEVRLRAAPPTQAVPLIRAVVPRAVGLPAVCPLAGVPLAGVPQAGVPQAGVPQAGVLQADALTAKTGSRVEPVSTAMVAPLAAAAAVALVPTAALLCPAKAVPLPPLGPVAVGRRDRPAHERELPRHRARGTTADRDNARPNTRVVKRRRRVSRAWGRIR